MSHDKPQRCLPPRTSHPLLPSGLGGQESLAAPFNIIRDEPLWPFSDVSAGQQSRSGACMQGALGPVAHVPAREVALQSDAWPVVCAAGDCTSLLVMLVPSVAVRVLRPCLRLACWMWSLLRVALLRTLLVRISCSRERANQGDLSSCRI